MKHNAQLFSNICPTERLIVEKYISSVPVKLGAMAKDLGIIVKITASLPRNISGQIFKEGDRYQIRINRFESPRRQRFTLAHEIAHFLLHREIIDASEDGINDNVLYKSIAPEHCEAEAKQLAAQLLLSETLCRMEGEIEQ